MKYELWGWLDLILLRHSWFVNFGFLVGALGFTVLWWKAYIVKNGEFRRRLLCFWGSGAVACFCIGVFYHPFYNVWIPPFFLGTHLICLLRLVAYTIWRWGVERHGGDDYP